MEVDILVVPPVTSDKDKQAEEMICEPEGETGRGGASLAEDPAPEPVNISSGTDRSPPHPEVEDELEEEAGGEESLPRSGSLSEGSNSHNNNLSNRTNNNNKKPHRRGKHKGGRRHHRQWKPYSKMSWEEKKALEERETRRACKKREDRFASGQPMAPYNTTQFLMEQHEPSEVNLTGGGAGAPAGPPGIVGGLVKRSLNKSNEENGGSGSDLPSSEEYYSSPDDEEIFLEKEFTEAYENYHAERLLTLNKDELVREYLELESKVEVLEKQSREHQLNGRLSSGGEESKENNPDKSANSPQKTASKPPKIEEEEEGTEVCNLREEIKKLKEENEKLRQDNQDLRQTASSVNIGEP